MMSNIYVHVKTRFRDLKVVLLNIKTSQKSFVINISSTRLSLFYCLSVGVIKLIKFYCFLISISKVIDNNDKISQNKGMK